VRSFIGAIALAGMMITAAADLRAFDETKYPDWSGQWRRPAGVGNQWDTSRPPRNGQGTDPTYICIPDGMPRAMNVIFPMEIIIQPHVTHMLIEYLSMVRRIYTDGRDWPENAEPSFMGYSIGKWVDTGGRGRFDVLEVETRNLKGPRSFDASGLPLHVDNQTIVKERIYLNSADPNIMHDEVTTIDNALTRPWTVTKNYHRVRKPVWVEAICAEGNQHVRIGTENYMLSADGYLMPAKKGQAPPDLRYFDQARK
jgi:hypothetical protein